ncbi:LysR family transcriptional regulator [Marivirga atlantica]|uniref:LysR family transcriptional regulator n=1 Tax=Marivirga atlantica TaxID=1548457 RepID=A0A937ADI6_9BACT|nr:LysR family transcriptional regulator [Marivirga atlantica]MBL0764701.1 LysR family transcriptional regulator [Marivirga atlantica]
MNYTINQLQIFLKVTQKKSITKAAEELFMTQPAVSIQLKNFQDQFDIPLTEVIGRQLYVTEFGEEIALIAEKIIQEIANINYKTQAYKGLLTGKLKIFSASTGKYVIPFFLSGFIEQNTAVDLVLDVTNKTMVMESLKNNQTELALVSVVPENVQVEEEIIIANKLFLIGSQPNRSANIPLIYREKGSATRAAMENYFLTHEGSKRKRLELTSNEAVKQAVIAGLGNSIMPVIGIKNELLNKQLYIIESEGLPISTEWRLIWLKGKKLSPVAQAFLDYVRKEKTRILDEQFKWYMKF